MALFARKRSPTEIVARAPVPPRRLPELDAYSRRQLEAVCQRADALTSSLEARPAPPKRPSPGRQSKPAFEDAPTNPFIPLEPAPLRLRAEPDDIPIVEDVTIVEEPSGTVIVDEELLHADEGATTPCAHIPARRPER